MFNPLCVFDLKYLDAFRKKGVKAFVKQTYPRGRGNDPDVQAFILIHFENLLSAQQYFDVLQHDPGRELLIFANPADVERIKELIATSRIFMMLKVRDAEYRVKKLLDKKVRAYIEYILGWRPGREYGVSFQLDVQFGEVYARLKFRSKEIKVKLEEIENAHYVL